MRVPTTAWSLALAVIAIAGNSSPSWADVPDGCTPNEAATQFSDGNGDNRADAIVINIGNAGHLTLRASNTQRFLPNESWTTGPYFGSKGTYFADVDGDNKADAIVVNDDKITVRRSDGTKFSGNESWTNEPYYGQNQTVYFADVDGDNRPLS
jgi:hypothetical protein